MTELVIFDLDGTLVDSLEDLADSVNVVLKDHGYPTHNTEEYKRFVGNGTVKLIERALPKEARTPERVEELHGIFSGIYKENCLVKTAPYDGVRQVVEKLKDSGVKIAVASNKPDAFAKQIVEKLFGKDTFDIVAGQTDLLPKKPEPDIVFHIMDKLAANRDNTVYVGDSDVDVITGHNAGLKVCGCSWGFRTRSELVTAGADYILETAYDLLSVIEINK